MLKLSPDYSFGFIGSLEAYGEGLITKTELLLDAADSVWMSLDDHPHIADAGMVDLYVDLTAECERSRYGQALITMMIHGPLRTNHAHANDYCDCY